MRLGKLARHGLTAGIMLLLAACVTTQDDVPPLRADLPQELLPPPDLVMQRALVNATECKSKHCPTFNASWASLRGDAATSALLEQLAVQLTQRPELGGVCGGPQAGLRAMADQYFKSVENPEGCFVSMQLVRELPGVVVVDGIVSSGTHRVEQSFNIDRAHQHVLALDEIVAPGRHDAFVAAFAGTRANMAADKGCPWTPADDGSCPFPATSEFQYTEDGLGLVYRLPPVNGKYVTWVISLRYPDLQGLVQPAHVLPH